ncbi:hypothetical protein BS47DRAFT_1393887 [Hydnum rufescens UP504]|uniref:Uncharacterized protein n=1 Tax=Hydnum rufescens UP504 TaxID=1448309 RepID=A0A9P6AY08_9AGAM|nr:hypothetical protein BS47DRAFT_1393887 [Hydnum rufescens UP504]
MAETVDVTPRAALATLADHSSQLGQNATFTGPIDVNGPITLPENLLDASERSCSELVIPKARALQRQDVLLLSLQLLGYLSKSPYLRQAFYKPWPNPTPTHSSSTSSQSDPPSDPSRPSMNIFSLVERFAFRPSPSEPQLPHLPNEIQYWGGVIMRNACRKDEGRRCAGDAEKRSTDAGTTSPGPTAQLTQSLVTRICSTRSGRVPPRLRWDHQTLARQYLVLLPHLPNLWVLMSMFTVVGIELWECCAQPPLQSLWSAPPSTHGLPRQPSPVSTDSSSTSHPLQSLHISLTGYFSQELTLDTLWTSPTNYVLGPLSRPALECGRVRQEAVHQAIRQSLVHPCFVPIVHTVFRTSVPSGNTRVELEYSEGRGSNNGMDIDSQQARLNQDLLRHTFFPRVYSQ